MTATTTTKPDPYSELTRADERAAKVKNYHKRRMSKTRAKARAQLMLIAQLVGEGQPREAVRLEIIRMLEEWRPT